MEHHRRALLDYMLILVIIVRPNYYSIITSFITAWSNRWKYVPIGCSSDHYALIKNFLAPAIDFQYEFRQKFTILGLLDTYDFYFRVGI